MKIGVIKEVKTHEYRVALTPDCVRSYVSRGHQAMVEQDAGVAAGFDNEEYAAAGGDDRAEQEGDLRPLRHDRQGQGTA